MMLLSRAYICVKLLRGSFRLFTRCSRAGVPALPPLEKCVRAQTPRLLKLYFYWSALASLCVVCEESFWVLFGWRPPAARAWRVGREISAFLIEEESKNEINYKRPLMALYTG